MTKADPLIHSAKQFCVIPAHRDDPQRGSELGDLLEQMDTTEIGRWND